VSGIQRLLAGLADGGYLLVGQNSTPYPGGEEAYFVLRRRGTGSILAEENGGHDLLRWLRHNRPEILGEIETSSTTG